MPLLNTCKNDVTLFRAVENHAAVSGRYHPPSVQFSSPAITDALCQENRNTPVCVKRSNEIFRNFKKLLVHHYREEHTIQFYADQLHISTTYLSRIVKDLTGHTVCFHVSELLCADARKLLECTDMDIKEIADYLGFSDQSVFGKFFIRKTGLSPLKFRMRKETKPQKEKTEIQT